MSKPSKMHRRVMAAAAARAEGKQSATFIEQARQKTDDPQLKAALDVLDKNPNIKVPQNTWWDDARNYYEMTRNNIIDSMRELAACVDDAVATKPEINKDAELVALITGLQVDTVAQLDRLDKIYALHSQYSGAVATPNESMLCIDVNAQYEECAQIHATTTVPTIAHVFDKIGAMTAVLEDAQQAQQAQAQDPEQVTDVEFTEVKG